MHNRIANFILASVQVILGWEWLISGGNKILSNTFPQQLSATLQDGLKDNPNGWYVAFIHQSILPQSI